MAARILDKNSASELNEGGREGGELRLWETIVLSYPLYVGPQKLAVVRKLKFWRGVDNPIIAPPAPPPLPHKLAYNSSATWVKSGCTNVPCPPPPPPSRMRFS